MKVVAILLVVAAAGAGAGVSLANGGVLDLADDPIVSEIEAVPYYRCPGRFQIGNLHHGDLAYAVARDESGHWLLIRDLEDLSERVWVRTDATETEDPQSLPVAEPAEGCTIALPETTPSPEPTDEPDATPTLAPDATPAPTPTPGRATPTIGPVGTPTIEPSTGLEIGSIDADPDEIYENGSPAICTGPKTSEVSVEITSDAPIDDVTLTWSVPGSSEPGSSGSKSMSFSGGRWRATVGTFSDFTIDDDTSVQLRVEADDDDGNTDSRTSSSALELLDCGPTS